MSSQYFDGFQIMRDKKTKIICLYLSYDYNSISFNFRSEIFKVQGSNHNLPAHMK